MLRPSSIEAGRVSWPMAAPHTGCVHKELSSKYCSFLGFLKSSCFSPLMTEEGQKDSIGKFDEATLPRRKSFL